ncbi:TPA: putative 2-aminoethylphosphonate ABC transporter substrate-binding protein [Vibrio parahaemolyticus]|uniref:putative 2-aminoethylphosphonate ABC transporter substrate-binding protein n=1 Tax=Vibrio parahaemolyticus TaxID=670 RepID=UPI0004A04200|nr:putative 2-aminoethylphosphonate ABC transporter substrate-binding protein [Vibrio parahaemolyticus]KCV75200.1 phosphonate ABC transporter substrate-binding protein [Vibrio parahaemolyticus VP49]EGQ8179015.1 putative 2-aminoethylphosphonate ABC transporter substrate-binding protein [Vibrio parahaemolyticus]MCI9722286.1 putative 2-aminoethylphosphonate ABC transporter substrate-binding protein [Vibrio parahaemolyticus]MCZ6390904.1 putative 2-aminoethylphosphonate ABC transporter substrate-bin
MMKNRLMKGSLAALVSLLATNAMAAQEVTVYTAFETDILAKYKSAFEKDNPDIKIKWVRDSTGIMTAKLLAEKNNPQAEVVWGLAGSSMALLKDEGLLKPYTPKGLEELYANLNDPQSNQAWFGNDAFFNAVCFNEAVAKQLNLPKPTSWEDLTKPVYKGHIAMPNPASSGTGYMQVSAWLQNMGEDQAWNYMRDLDKNIAHYTHSGSKPCVQAGMGEVAIGISMASRGAKLKTQGAPLAVITPKGIGWESEAVGLVKESDAAKRVVDWSISKAANELYVEMYPVVGHKEVKATVSNFPNVQENMAKMDFAQMGSKRAEILATWSEKFDAKSEPKS